MLVPIFIPRGKSAIPFFMFIVGIFFCFITCVEIKDVYDHRNFIDYDNTKLVYSDNYEINNYVLHNVHLIRAYGVDQYWNHYFCVGYFEDINHNKIYESFVIDSYHIGGEEVLDSDGNLTVTSLSGVFTIDNYHQIFTYYAYEYEQENESSIVIPDVEKSMFPPEFHSAANSVHRLELSGSLDEYKAPSDSIMKKLSSAITFALIGGIIIIATVCLWCINDAKTTGKEEV